MTQDRPKASLLGRLVASVKVVGLVAIFGTIALAAVASHRSEVPLLEPRTVAIAPHMPGMHGVVSAYLQKAAEAAAEIPST
jgi:hypothetical protein